MNKPWKPKVYFFRMLRDPSTGSSRQVQTGDKLADFAQIMIDSTIIELTPDQFRLIPEITRLAQAAHVAGQNDKADQMCRVLGLTPPHRNH